MLYFPGLLLGKPNRVVAVHEQFFFNGCKELLCQLVFINESPVLHHIPPVAFFLEPGPRLIPPLAGIFHPLFIHFDLFCMRQLRDQLRRIGIDCARNQADRRNIYAAHFQVFCQIREPFAIFFQQLYCIFLKMIIDQIFQFYLHVLL